MVRRAQPARPGGAGHLSLAANPRRRLGDRRGDRFNIRRGAGLLSGRPNAVLCASLLHPRYEPHVRSGYLSESSLGPRDFTVTTLPCRAAKTTKALGPLLQYRQEPLGRIEFIGGDLPTMPSLIETIGSQLTPQTISAIAGQLGVDERTAQQSIGIALPLLVSALARNTQSRLGAQSLSRALKKDHDGSILADVPTAVAQYQAGQGDGILRHLLGESRPAVEQTLQRGTNVDAGQLLMMLAPIVMGVLGQMQQKKKLTSTTLSETLLAEQKHMGGTNSDLMGVVTRLLDANSDGSMVDDVIGLRGRRASQK